MLKTVLHRTGVLLGTDFSDCQSRSLMLERLADPTLKDENRKNFFNKAISKQCDPKKAVQWLSFLLNDLRLASTNILYAQLQSRLMVNMAGGIMENAGICLDRFSGLPFIPGSAVRGCSRRMAIQKTADETDPDKKKTMLAEIALAFGWGEEDWKTREDHGAHWEEKRPDFAHAVGDTLWHQEGFIATVQSALWDRIHGMGGYSALRWNKHLRHYRGQTKFLAAYPVQVNDDPQLPLNVQNPGRLELDVLTSHHQDYYSRRIAGGTRVMPEARDVENPIPVVFPAVASGIVFVFAVTGSLTATAIKWLEEGLQIFGLGAKTNAGYGWFETKKASPIIAKQIKDWHNEQNAKRLEAEQRAMEADAEIDRLAKLSPLERRTEEFLKLGNDAFAGRAKSFEQMNDEDRRAFVFALKRNREKAKNWGKKRPYLLEPWKGYAQTLNPPIILP